MATKVDIKKILSKGLTGKEAARLILQDSWDVDHQREGFLSERDISSIKAGLKTTQDIEDYNRFVDIYRLVDYTLKDAHIFALEAQNLLLLSIREIEKYLLEDRIRILQFVSLPAIVTQKQYEELKAKQREWRLKEVFNLKQILDKRAERLTPKDIQDKQWEEDEEGNSYEYLIYLLYNDYPDLWKQTVSSLLEDIKAGKLKLVLITGKDQERLEKAWQAIRDSQQKDIKAEVVSEKLDPASEANKKTERLRQEEEKLTRELYQAGRAKISQESLDSLTSSLEQLLAGTLSTDEEDKLLEYVFCSAEDLYQAGLPEWIQDIDRYIPNLDEETAARPAGMMQSNKVAIIQDPEPEDVDKRGYWTEKDPLSVLSGYERTQMKAKRGLDIPEVLLTFQKKISERVKIFLAIQAVTEAISKVVGVNFTEDMDDWYQDIENHIKMYNGLLTPRSSFGLPHYLGMPKLDQLKIGKLKPTAKSVKYYKDRMAIALGQAWWREALETLEFEAEEQDSLAKKVLSEINEVQKMELKDTRRSEEASDGQEA